MCKLKVTTWNSTLTPFSFTAFDPTGQMVQHLLRGSRRKALNPHQSPENMMPMNVRDVQRVKLDHNMEESRIHHVAIKKQVESRFSP